jgi:hypothetical protein
MAKAASNQEEGNISSTLVMSGTEKHSVSLRYPAVSLTVRETSEVSQAGILCLSPGSGYLEEV